MEGPYLTELGPMEQQLVHLVLVEDRMERKVRCETDVDARALVHSILSAAERTLAECRTRGWWSVDADRLLAASDALRQEFQEH
jgi:hypothetical protein